MPDIENPNARSMETNQKVLNKFVEHYREEDSFFEDIDTLTIIRQLGIGGSGEVFQFWSERKRKKTTPSRSLRQQAAASLSARTGRSRHATALRTRPS